LRVEAGQADPRAAAGTVPEAATHFVDRGAERPVTGGRRGVAPRAAEVLCRRRKRLHAATDQLAERAQHAAAAGQVVLLERGPVGGPAPAAVELPLEPVVTGQVRVSAGEFDRDESTLSHGWLLGFGDSSPGRRSAAAGSVQCRMNDPGGLMNASNIR